VGVEGSKKKKKKTNKGGGKERMGWSGGAKKSVTSSGQNKNLPRSRRCGGVTRGDQGGEGFELFLAPPHVKIKKNQGKTLLFGY